MRCNLAGLAIIAGGIAGVYWLMLIDAHILAIAAFGASCGSVAGGVLRGWRGTFVGAVLGFLAPFAYLPLWLVFDLPPTADFDL